MDPERPFMPKDYLKAFKSFFDAESCNTLQPQSYCVDIHCHSTFMPFNRQGKYPPLSDHVRTSREVFWPAPTSPEKVEAQRFHKTPTFYQSDFTALAQSNVRLAFVSLLPLEQGFVWTREGGTLPAADLRLAEEPESLGKQSGIPVLNELSETVMAADLNPGEALGIAGAALVMKIPMARTEHVQARHHDYFNDLVAEYELLTNESYWQCPGLPGVPPGAKVQVVGNSDELKKALEQPHVTAAIVTVEGGHSLGCGSLKWREKIRDDELDDAYPKMGGLRLDEDSFRTPTDKCDMVTRFKKKPVQELVLQLLLNIKQIKGWGPDGKFAPFFLTFSHHFWNQLCGHAISLPYKFGIPFFNQQLGVEKELTEVGKVVLSALLSKNNGRRVLIDTKHMSLKGKRWYYDSIKNLKIPIISSHAAPSGVADMPTEPTTTDCGVADSNYRHTGEFNSWDINLSDEEIQTIHQSDGLIGLNFDERILTGHERNAELHQSAPAGGGRDTVVWAELIADRICRFAKAASEGECATNKEDWWRHLAIGSDFDGAINPVDAYCWAGDLTDLRTPLLAKLKGMWDTGLGPSDDAVEQDDYIENIVDGFLHQNALDFLAKYFTDEYRT